MADNPPPTPTPAPNPGPRPTLPGGATGRLKNPTTQLPAVKKAGAGKIVVMLSSVAKPPPAGTQALPRVAPPAAPVPPLPETTPAPKPAPVEPPPTANRPPPLPPKTVAPANDLPSPSRPQLSTTTYVKLPPKTAVPGWNALSGKPLVPPSAIIATTAPFKTPEPKKPGAQHIPPIKLNEPAPQETSAEESIFPQRQPGPGPKPEAPKNPAAPTSSTPPIVLKAPEGPLVSLDLFERSQTASPKPAPPVVTPEAKSALPPLVAPPLMPPQRLSATPLTTNPLPSVRPPPLPPPVAKPVERAPEPQPSRHVAPPMLDQAPEPVAEKLPPPLLAKPAESIAPPPLHVAPPMLDQAPEPIAEKLPPPLVTKPSESVAPPPLHVAPPMLDRAPEPVAEKLPPPLVAKPSESVAPPPLHVAPPMLDQTPEPIAEKLPPPHLPTEARTSESPPPLPESSAVAKAPELVKPEAPPPKPLQPPKPPRAKTGWFTKSTPVVVSSASQKIKGAPIAEAKPALKPAVLPARLQQLPPPIPPAVEPATPPTETPKAIEEPAKKVEAVAAAVTAAAAEAVLPAMVEQVTPPTVTAKEEPEVKSVPLPAKPEATTPPTPPPKAAPAAKVPPTRAERAKSRRFWSSVAFWGAIFPASIAALFFASLHFGRDTRVEGQVIPPPGMTLSDEVWIVTDFRSLASGIAEDLAAERTPLLQEIEERQDHVQRAQADIATREERIRLLQDEIAASKAEIDTIVKQARDATQQVWDVDGAAIDAEYTSRQNQLQQTIADRAKSLKLNYQPDPEFNSPEVWANAYRLALYQVPPGVDSAKEHLWLGDQMKAWRDFQKSLDDRKEALREKAAQIKLGPAPRIADLNTKMDDLQQRIDATQAEEVPLKTELQQAQADLVAVQSAEAGLDDKYYQQLDSLPGEAVTKHIPLRSNGRFTWIEDDVFVEGEKAHHYWIFARATRPDGRQYWALHHFEIGKNQTLEMSIEPTGFISTKAILRPNLSPEEQEQ